MDFLREKNTPKSFTRKGSSKKCLKNAAIIFMHLRRRLQRRKSVFANTHIASFWITSKFPVEHVYLKIQKIRQTARKEVDCHALHLTLLPSLLDSPLAGIKMA